MDNESIASNPNSSRKDGLLGGCGLRVAKTLTRSPIASITLQRTKYMLSGAET